MKGTLLLTFTFFFTHFVVSDVSDQYDFTVAETDTVQLKCDRNTDAVVNWKYRKRHDESSVDICIGGRLSYAYASKFELNSTDFTLTINNVTVDDSGAYSCIEVSDIGETHIIQLTVARVFTVVEGDLVHLQCDRGSDHPVDWRYQRVLAEYNPYIVIGGILSDEYKTRFQLNPIVFTLTINSVTLNDSGFYSCIEDSGIGETHLVKLVVAGRASSLTTTMEKTTSTSASNHDCLGADTKIILALQSFIVIAVTVAAICVFIFWQLCRKKRTRKTDKQSTGIELEQLSASKGDLCHHDDRPLNNSELHHIEFNTPRLVELIDPNEDFLTELVNARCIMRRDKEQIMALTDRRQKNEKLLDILRGRNNVHLKKFVECLSSNQQKHLTPLLVDAGIIVDVDATLDETSVDDVDQSERQIVSTFEKTMLDDVHKQCTAELQSVRKEAKERMGKFGVDIDLVVLRVQSSIGCYFFCRTSNSLHHLFVLYGNKQLRQILESIFNILLRADQRVRIKRLVWMIDYYQQCTQYFTRQSRHDGSIGVRQIALPPQVSGSPKLLVYSRDERKSPSHICMSPKVLVYSNCRQGKDQTILYSHDCVTPKILVYSRSKIGQENGHRDTTSIELRKLKLTDIHSLPLELHEMILMSSLYRLTKSLFPIDHRPNILLAMKIETRAHVIAFKTLSSVCEYFHQVIAKRKWFGRQLKRRLIGTCRPYRLQPRLLQRLDTGQPGMVTGLAELKNKLYIMYADSTTIGVYTAHQPYRQLHYMQLNGLKSPQNLAVDFTNNCLYVVDAATGVWRVRADHKVDTWIHAVRANNVSVTSEGRLMILIATDVQNSKENREWHGRIEVYSADKLKLTVLKLPHDVVNPFHAVQTTTKTFIVSHGNHKTSLNRVVELNNKGFVVRAYGGPFGSGLGQLNMPLHIALDTGDRVLVADSNNHRVLLLDEKLNIERVLLSWSGLDGVQGPRSIYYDREKSQLLVGLREGYVDIYSV